MTPWSMVHDRDDLSSDLLRDIVPFEIFVSPLVPVLPDMPLSGYEDDVWDLRPITRKSSGKYRTTINFGSIPVRYRESAKRVGWCWINLRTPIENLTRGGGVRARERLSTSSIASMMQMHCKTFFCWLDERDIESLSQVTVRDLHEFLAATKARKIGVNMLSHQLFIVTRIWLLGPYLPESDRLPKPPWEEANWSEATGISKWAVENKTQPIHPQTMAALYMWAERFLTVFAADITRAVNMNAYIHANARTRVWKGDDQRFEAYKAMLKATNTSFPSYTRGRLRRAAPRVVSGLYNIGVNAMLAKNRRELEIGDAAPLPLDVQGVIPGDTAPWLNYIDHYEVPRLRVRLATACLILTAYLTGMRPDEVTNLRRGCVKAIPHAEGQPSRYAIVGLEFKRAKDEDGNAVPDGQTREHPWYAIETVAQAINMCEELSATEYVFDREVFSEIAVEHGGGSIVVTHTPRYIQDFIDWVKEYCTMNNRPHETIPEDPEGNVTLRRFRRTLAWFIYRQPGGRIALGLQYAHLHGYTSEGYGHRISSGLSGIFPMEEALATADFLANAAEQLQFGEGVSGPAKTRYINGISQFSREYGGSRLSAKELNAISKNPRYRIYDNGMQPVACCYDATKALCHSDNNLRENQEQSPDLTRCQPLCANIARTDRNIEGVGEEIKDLEGLILVPAIPEPIRSRYQQRIESLRELVDAHEATKITL